MSAENFNHMEEGIAQACSTYEHSQITPSKVWVISHNLGKKPAVMVIDDSGCLCICDIEYTDENTAVLQFSEATSGKAYLN